MAEQEQAAEKTLAISKIYIKDFSFESPQAPAVFKRSDWKPQTNLNLRSSHTVVEDNVHEVVLTITVEAKDDDKTLFLVELRRQASSRLPVTKARRLSAIARQLLPEHPVPICARGRCRHDPERRLSGVRSAADQLRRAVHAIEAAGRYGTGRGHAGGDSLISDSAPKTIAVIGAGSWGTALALQFARVGCDVRLGGVVELDLLEAMVDDRENKRYLPDVAFPGQPGGLSGPRGVPHEARDMSRCRSQPRTARHADHDQAAARAGLSGLLGDEGLRAQHRQAAAPGCRPKCWVPTSRLPCFPGRRLPKRLAQGCRPP